MAEKIVELDVRDDLKNKVEPFPKIMNAVERLEKGDIFILHSSIKPIPLINLMETKGYTSDVEKKDNEHYITTFKKKKNSLFFWQKEKLERPSCPQQDGPTEEIFYLDNRGLEPPQPMVRTLARLETMKDGEVLTIRNDRVPAFLIEELDQLGYDYTTKEMEDQTFEVTITKKEG